MPTYQYVCDACHTEFERVQRFSDDPIRDCPSCGAPKARRRISAAGIVFKGSGWYVHDSKRVLRPAATESSGDKPGNAPAAREGKDDGRAKDGAAAGDNAGKGDGGAAAPAAPAAPATPAAGPSTPGATSGTSSPTARSAT